MISPNSLEFHVAPSGNDDASGKLAGDGPFATLHRAARAVAEAVTSGHSPRIIVHPGVYPMDRPLTLDAGHSGSPSSPVTWKAREPGTAILSGSIVLEGLVPVTDPTILKRLPEKTRSKILTVDLKGKIETPPIPYKGGPDLDLFSGGRRLPRSRCPTTGWLKVADVPQTGPVRHNEGLDREKRFDGIPAGRHYGRITYPDDRPSNWSPDNEVYLHGYWTFDWSDTIHRAERIDTGQREITLAEPHHVFGYTRNQRFAYLNVLEELDGPGEWVIESGRLYFLPPENWNGEVEVSRLSDPLIRVENGGNISIQGLILECSRGHAIAVSGGDNIAVEGCTLRNLGLDAIRIDGGHGHRIDSCDLHDLACGGIQATGGDRKTLSSSGFELINNHIHDFCQWLHTGFYGISFDGVGFHIAHNLIHDSPFEAIYLRGNEHILEFNDVHSVMKGSGDAGALHTGRDYTWQGNIIRHNYWHHLQGPGLHGVMGVYLDDFSCGFSVYGNIFYRAGRATLLSGGHDNTLENNLYVDCQPSVHYDARGLSWAAYYFDGTYTWLADRYDELDADQPPYSDRYPRLKDIFDREPAVPKRNRIVRNISMGTGRWIDIYDYFAFDFSVSAEMKDNIIANPGLCRRREKADGFMDPYYLNIDGVEGYVLLTKEGAADGPTFSQNQIRSAPIGHFDPQTLVFTPADPDLLDSIQFQPIPVEKIGLRTNTWRPTVPGRQPE